MILQDSREQLINYEKKLLEILIVTSVKSVTNVKIPDLSLLSPSKTVRFKSTRRLHLEKII